MEKTKINTKSLLLSQEIIDYAELIKESIESNQPPTYFIKNMIITLRKLDHLSENSFFPLDDLLFSESFK